MKAGIGIALCALMIAGCTRSPTAVNVDFEPDALATSAEAVEVFVVASCADVTRGEVPLATFARSVLRRGETALSLGATPADRFAVYALARSSTCDVVAAGCVETTRNASSVTVVVTAQTGDACTGSAVCARGVCESDAPDAHVADAGEDAPSDAGDDAGVDAAILCTPSCPTGLICTAGGCSPSFVEASREGMLRVGTLGGASRGTDDGVDALFVLGNFHDSMTFAGTTLANVGGGADGFVVRAGGGGPEWAMKVELGDPTGRTPSLTDLVVLDDEVWITGYSGDANGEVGFADGIGCVPAMATTGAGSGSFLTRLDVSTGCATDPLFFSGNGIAQAITTDGAQLFMAGAGGPTITIFAETTISESDNVAWIAQVLPPDGPTAGTCGWIHTMNGNGDYTVEDIVAVAAARPEDARTCIAGIHTGTILAEAGFPAASGGAFLECVDGNGALVIRQGSSDGGVRALDIAGDVLFAAGWVEGTLTFRGAEGAPVSATWSGAEGGWIGAFDLATGDCLWIRSFGGAARVRLDTISVSPDVGIYVSAAYESDLVLGPEGVSFSHAQGGHAVLRFDGSSALAPTLVWARDLAVSDAIFDTTHIVGSGVHLARFGDEIAYAGWAPGRVDVGGTTLARDWGPFFVARFLEIE